jgi:hypothetical protein
MSYRPRQSQRNALNANTYVAPNFMPPRQGSTDDTVSVAIDQPGYHHGPEFPTNPHARPGTHQDLENFVGVHPLSLLFQWAI